MERAKFAQCHCFSLFFLCLFASSLFPMQWSQKIFMVSFDFLIFILLRRFHEIFYDASFSRRVTILRETGNCRCIKIQNNYKTTSATYVALLCLSLILEDRRTRNGRKKKLFLSTTCLFFWHRFALTWHLAKRNGREPTRNFSISFFVVFHHVTLTTNVLNCVRRMNKKRDWKKYLSPIWCAKYDNIDGGCIISAIG